MTQKAPITGFSPGERDYIRRELDMFFSTLPTVAEGFQLKTWRGGPEAGKPKVPPVARSLVDRGLMRLGPSLTVKAWSVRNRKFKPLIQTRFSQPRSPI